MKNQTKLLKLCTIALLCLIAVACKEEISDPGPGEDKPFPFLEVGNEWHYTHRYISKDNGAIDTNIDTEIIRLDTTMLRIIDGEDFQIYMMYDSATSGYYDGGFFAHNVSDSSFYPFGQDFKLLYWNCHLGQKWYAGNNGVYNCNAEIISMSEVVETPAGLFDCIKVEMTPSADQPDININHDYYYINRKYGLIKRDILNGTEESNMQMISTLDYKNF